MRSPRLLEMKARAGKFTGNRGWFLSSEFQVALYMYIIYTPKLGLGIAVTVREREVTLNPRWAAYRMRKLLKYDDESVFHR